MSDQEIKASDLFVRCLEAEGVTHIFGVPGEENADVMMSLMDSSIDFVLCRHEQAAAFMADTYGRLTGKPGVCLATLGPGATNLVTGVADANMDRAPLVAIIGQAETSRLHKESHQNMDAIAMFRPITKWAHSIGNAKTIPEVIRKAFKVATIDTFKKPPAATGSKKRARDESDLPALEFLNEISRGGKGTGKKTPRTGGSGATASTMAPSSGQVSNAGSRRTSAYPSPQRGSPQATGLEAVGEAQQSGAAAAAGPAEGRQRKSNGKARRQ